MSHALELFHENLKAAIIKILNMKLPNTFEVKKIEKSQQRMWSYKKEQNESYRHKNRVIKAK